MRRKSTFSRREADKIRKLLIRIGTVPDRPSTQRRLRALIREEYGLYISDYDVDTGGKGFTVAHFDALVEAGQVTVLDLDFNDVSCSKHSYMRSEEERERYNARLRDLRRAPPGQLTYQHACAICAYERGKADGARELAKKLERHLKRFL